MNTNQSTSIGCIALDWLFWGEGNAAFLHHRTFHYLSSPGRGPKPEQWRGRLTERQALCAAFEAELGKKVVCRSGWYIVDGAGYRAPALIKMIEEMKNERRAKTDSPV